MGPRRRHAVFFDAYPNMYAGTARSVELLALELPAHGYSAEVVLPHDGPVAERMRAHGVSVSVVPTPSSLRGYGRSTRGWRAVRATFALPRYWLRLRRHFRASGGVVHVTSHRSVVLAAPAARLARRPVVWLISQIEDDRGVSRLSDFLATRTIASSKAARTSLPRRRIARDVDVIVPFPVDPRFESVEPLAPVAPPVIVTTGRLEPSKGQLLLLDAFALVRESVPDARLRIIGGEQEGHEMYAAEVARRAGAFDGAVEITGWAETPETHLRDASVYVCCSRIEGLGIAVVEAMACGLPVVVTGNTGIAEFLDDGRSALVVANDDPRAMADAILRILREPALARELALAGRELVPRFSIARIAAETASVFDELSAGAPR